MNTPSRLRTLLTACAVSASFAVLLLATSSRLPIVWDEGDTIVRAEDLAGTSPSPLMGEVRGEGVANNQQLATDDQARPLTLLASGERSLSREGRGEALAGHDHWPYTTVREGHPPLAGIVVAVGTWLAPSWLDPLTQARFGPMLLFALAAGAMYYRLERDYGVKVVGLVAVAALATMPRLFAHAHFATLDGPLTACWVLAWAAFAPAVRDWRWIPCFGLALGLTLTAKFTGWLAPLPFLAWAILYRSRGGIAALAVGLPLAIAVFIVLNPPLWSEPLVGLRTFFELNLHRGDRPGLNISTLFFGRMYNLDHPLPWYNTLVWTLVTVSPMITLFAAVGIVSTVRRWRTDPAGLLLVCQWAMLIIVRALPLAPPHDAERLILPSFAFYAALAGVGAGRCLYRNTLLVPDKIPAQGWAKVALGIALTAATFDSISYFPHNLSYYSRLIGGLRGATALGMEPTYYWDALDDNTLAWLAAHTADDEKVAFAAAPPRNLELLKRWGRLVRLPDDPGRFRWYVLQRRPSAWQPADGWLIEHVEPAYRRTCKGVPLLDVYGYQHYEQAVAATR